MRRMSAVLGLVVWVGCSSPTVEQPATAQPHAAAAAASDEVRPVAAGPAGADEAAAGDVKSVAAGPAGAGEARASDVKSGAGEAATGDVKSVAAAGAARPVEAGPADAGGVPEGVVAGAEPSPKLEVEARLVETNSAPHCGVVHSVVVMRYEVVRVISGSYPAKELYVAHSCPEMSSTSCEGQAGPRIRGFRAGEMHHLELKRGKGSGAVVDKFKDKTLPRYRAQCGNMIEAQE